MSVEEEDFLHSAVARIEGDVFFMASVLAAYRREFQIDDPEIARMLHCRPQDLVNVALCRKPRLEDHREFLSDIRVIAEYAHCDWSELAKLTRAVQSLSTLRALADGSQRTLLKAARPKRTPGPKPGRPRRRN